MIIDDHTVQAVTKATFIAPSGQGLFWGCAARFTIASARRGILGRV